MVIHLTVVCPASGGVVADPTDCSRYYDCGDRTTYHFRCPAGTLFDPTRRYCNWAHQVR